MWHDVAMMIDEHILRTCIMIGLAQHGDALIKANIDVGPMIESLYNTLAEVIAVHRQMTAISNAGAGKAGTTAD